MVPWTWPRPARLNDEIYKPVNPDDPTIIALASSIRQQGLLEPLVLTLDRVILSGHRRFAACKLAGLRRIPVRWYDVRSTDPTFPQLLVTFNAAQREKTPAEKIREEVIQTSPDAAFVRLATARAERLEQAILGADRAGLTRIGKAEARPRAEISEGKQAMLAAARRVLDDHRDYWPLSVRQVHYRLLNDPPERNTDPRYPTGTYLNDRPSYQDLSDLLARARIAGIVPWEAIGDETRPVSVWRKWPSVAVYVRQQLDDLFCDYRRDLLQSQPAHIEIVAEKMTVQSAADRVAAQFRANVMVGRGFSSVTARHDLVTRLGQSGKEQLVLLVVTDFDPAGECIAETLASSIRDEFGIDIPVRAHKVALTAPQVRAFGLPPGGTAKKGPGYEAFVRRHGEDTYELEALEPADLQRLIRDALVAVIDHDLLDHEQRCEVEEARELEARRRVLLRSVGEFEPD
jgi:hypothetical protein